MIFFVILLPVGEQKKHPDLQYVKGIPPGL